MVSRCHSRTGRIYALALTLLTLALHDNAIAAQKGQIRAAYVVEVGGVQMLKMSYDAAFTENTYQSSAAMKTKGLAGVFSDYKMDMTAMGAVSGNDARPSRFTSRAEKKDKDKTIELIWRDGKPPTVDPGLDADDERLLGNAVTAGLVDPLSMVMRMTALQRGQPCRTVERVFDGKEVYDLSFELKGKVTIGSGDEGSYRGQAYKCGVTYTPVAGRAAAKFRKEGDAPQKFNIWFAPARAGTDGAVFIPVLATGKLKGFNFVAYASKAAIDGVKLGSDSATAD
jgi:uncharacterized protein DUF3108